MVEVVFEEVVFREIGKIAVLDGREEGDVGGVGREGDYVDHLEGNLLPIKILVSECWVVVGRQTLIDSCEVRSDGFAEARRCC